MKKLKERKGFTLAEVLMVVAIIGILAGVSFVSVNKYQRSLVQIERDGVAKEIFVAAQNHLTAAYGTGYLGVSDYGTPGEYSDDDEDDTVNKVSFFTVNGSISESSLLGKMLPFGSIDDTVRLGGSYIVRYQKDTGLVLDVFYFSRSGEPSQFNHTLTGSQDEYKELLADFAGKNKKSARQNYKNSGAILGWYGGTKAGELANIGAELKVPSLEVFNGDVLKVTITDGNFTDGSTFAKVQGKYSLKLLVRGRSSGAEKAFVIKTSTNPIITTEQKYSGDRMPSLLNTEVNGPYTFILDDITANDTHFCEMGSDKGTFIPGENIEIQAVAYSLGHLSNVAYSSTVITNSLFDSIFDADLHTDPDPDPNHVCEIAYISHIRHLENLSEQVSKLSSQTSDNTLEEFAITDAKQTADLDWDDFLAATKGDNTQVVYYSGGGSSTISTNAKTYHAISPGYALSYDGQNHSISDIVVNMENAGLFGSVSVATKISNLELIDFDVKGKDSAGALAGELAGDASTVTNVIAHNTLAALGRTTPPQIASSFGSAGGLIGKMKGSMNCCGTALFVDGKTYAGGLIGESAGAITGSYSGGHVENVVAGGTVIGVKYSESSFDVTSATGTAGGLVGKTTEALTNSYSTCSATGAIAGGLAGSASGVVTKCYATGLVKGTSSQFAFIGDGAINPSSSDNRYYSVINSVPKVGGADGEMELMQPVSGYDITRDLSMVKPLDMNIDTFNDFVGGWNTWKPAVVYNTTLSKYYGGKYELMTVQEFGGSPPSGYSDWNQLFVSVHYGDWPSPEVFFINQ